MKKLSLTNNQTKFNRQNKIAASEFSYSIYRITKNDKSCSKSPSLMLKTYIMLLNPQTLRPVIRKFSKLKKFNALLFNQFKSRFKFKLQVPSLKI